MLAHGKARAEGASIGAPPAITRKVDVMALERLSGKVMQWFVRLLIGPTQDPPQRHGLKLLAFGSASLVVWLATVLLGVWLFLPRSEPTPDIGPASTGPPVKLTQAELDKAGSHARGGLGALIVPAILGIVFWGCYSGLVIAAGLFECTLGVEFGEINPWFSGLPWYQQILAFPFLLLVVLAVIGLPFGLLAAFGSLPNLE